MVIDMKGNSKMTTSMVKVHLSSKRIPFCVIYLFSFKIGKYFKADGTRYDGEFKDGKFNG